MLFKLAIDLTLSILSEWLFLEDITLLDNALCNDSDRAELLTIYSTKSFVHSGAYDSDRGDMVLTWLYRKKIAAKSLKVVMLGPLRVALTDTVHFYLRSFGSKLESFKLKFKTDYEIMSLVLIEDLIFHCKELKSLVLKKGLLASPYQISNELEQSSGLDHLEKLLLQGTIVHLPLFNVLFSNCTNLKELCIDLTKILETVRPDGSEFTPASDTDIREALSVFNQLTLLDISRHDDDLAETSVDCEAHCVEMTTRNASTLTTLDVSRHTDFTDATIKAIVTKCRSITTLKLAECFMLTDAAVEAVMINCTDIKMLVLRDCDHLSDKSILQVANKAKNITSLDISGLKCTSSSFFLLLAQCVHLSELLCDSCGPLGTKMPPMSTLTVASRTTPISQLTFVGCGNICDDFLIALVKVVPMVHQISLTACFQLTNKSLIPLIKKYGSELVDLELDELPEITDTIVTNIVKYCSEKLESVSLSDCERIKCNAVVKINKKFPECDVEQEKNGGGLMRRLQTMFEANGDDDIDGAASESDEDDDESI